MKSLLSILLILLFTSPLFGSDASYLRPDGTRGPERVFPNELRISLWENQFYKSTPETIQKFVNQLYILPRQPWPERLKVILLSVVDKYYKDGKYNSLVKRGCGEDLGMVIEMISWQDDARFIPHLLEWIGAKTSDSLARIGEPAFLPVVRLLERDGWPAHQAGAARALELMFEQEYAFLQKPANQIMIRQRLLKLAKQDDYLIRTRAVDALKYVGDQMVIDFLTILSRADIRQLENGEYPIRQKALQAIRYIESQ